MDLKLGLKKSIIVPRIQSKTSYIYLASFQKKKHIDVFAPGELKETRVYHLRNDIIDSHKPIIDKDQVNAIR